MTAADRAKVRAAIDLIQRHRRLARIQTLDLAVCSNCGCDHDTYTIGCQTCSNRRSKRRRRVRPR